MQKKTVAEQIYTILVAFVAISLLVFIIQSEITTFHLVLYRLRDYLNVDSIITQNLVPKLASGVILIVLGVFCYVFYITVIREKNLLIVVRLLFLSAAVIACGWEYETMFYIPNITRKIWISSGDILILFLNYTLISLLQSEYASAFWSKLKYFYVTFLLTSSIAILTTSSVQHVIIVELFVLVSVLLTAIFKIPKLSNQILSMMLIVCYTFFDILYLKTRTSSNLFQDRHLLTYQRLIVLGSAVGLYLYYYRKFHLRMMLSKDVNRQIRYANQYKYEITGKLIEAVENPINRIEGLNEILIELDNQTDASTHVLSAIEHEIKCIQNSLHYMKNNSLLVQNAYSVEKMPVNFNLIIQELLETVAFHVEEKASKDSHSSQYEFRNELKKNVSILGDPYLLTESFINILLELQNICNQDEQIKVRIYTDQTHRICIQMITPYDGKKRKQAIILHRVFIKKGFQNDTFQEELLPLISAKNLLLQHEGSYETELTKEQLILKCFLPQYGGSKNSVAADIAHVPMSSEDDFSSASEESQSFKNNAYVSIKPIIVLITNNAEQTVLISSYLMNEPFKLVVFSNGMEAIDYLNHNQGIILVLIGDVFSSMGYAEICQQIRKSFSLAQLSVVLLSNKPAYYINDSKLLEFNNILEGSFDRRHFLMIVYAAMRLNQSNQEIAKYQIDFLQSQVNPHFIFNTISTIMPLCLSNSFKAYEMLENFAEYLRGNLFVGSLHTKTTIQHEIDLIEAFLNIEKVRFEGMVDFDIIVSCDSNFPILPLIIEPLVENCIAHARIPGKVLKIVVKISQADNGVYVTVSDNGSGMTQEQIKEILDRNTGNSFGLINVIKRLRLYYQQELSITSTPLQGSTIQFFLPDHSE